MGTTLKLAWRNVWRQRRRTLLLVLVVAYAVAATIFIWGFNRGQTQSLLSNQARYLKAPAIIATPGYLSDPDPENALPNLDFVPHAEGVRGVAGATPRLEFYGVVKSAYRSYNGQVRGVAGGLEPLVSSAPSKITEGRMLNGPNEVVMGAGLARDLDVRLGERVAVEASSLAGPQALGFILVGTVDSDVPAVDDGLVMISLDDARTLTGVETATGVALAVARGQEDAVAARVATALQDVPGIHVYGLTELLGPLAEQANNTSSILLIALLFGLFAALAVTSTVLVSVLERSREFGMMGAIGMFPRRLALMVVAEAVITSVAGWLVGLVIGYAVTLVLGTWNILGPLFSSAAGGFADFGLGSELYTSSSPIFALYAAATVAFAALFAVIVPARKVLTMNVVEAMRSE